MMKIDMVSSLKKPTLKLITPEKSLSVRILIVKGLHQESLMINGILRLNPANAGDSLQIWSIQVFEPVSG